MPIKDEISFQQIISKHGDVMIVLSLDEFERLIARTAQHKKEVADYASEDIPLQVKEIMSQGATPLEAWRQFRGLSQTELANNAGVHRATVCRMEKNTQAGNRQTWAKIAIALGISAHMLH